MLIYVDVKEIFKMPLVLCLVILQLFFTIYDPRGCPGVNLSS